MPALQASNYDPRAAEKTSHKAPATTIGVNGFRSAPRTSHRSSSSCGKLRPCSGLALRLNGVGILICEISDPFILPADLIRRRTEAAEDFAENIGNKHKGENNSKTKESNHQKDRAQFTSPINPLDHREFLSAIPLCTATALHHSPLRTGCRHPCRQTGRRALPPVAFLRTGETRKTGDRKSRRPRHHPRRAHRAW